MAVNLVVIVKPTTCVVTAEQYYKYYRMKGSTKSVFDVEEVINAGIVFY